MKSILKAAGAASLLLGSGSALAQVVPQIDPGRVQDRLRPPELPRTAPQVVTPDIPASVAPEDAANVRFVVARVEIEGSTVYPASAFADLTAPLVGREISLAQAFTLAAEITARYRRDDYILSRAIVPAQRIENGVLRVQIVEGFVSGVAFEGPASGLLRKYGEALAAERPIRGKVLERYLLLMNDLPGVTARAVLAPSPDVAGGSQLSIVAAQKRFDAYAGFDNHGSRYIGPFEFYAGVAANDALGLNERLAVNFAGAAPLAELKYVSFQGDLPIAADGLLLTLNAGYSNSRPGFVLEALDARAEGTTLGARLSYPLVRSRAATLRLSLGFHYLDSRTVINGEPDLAPSSNDHVRALRLGANYDFADTLGGHNLIDLELSRGLNLLGTLDDNRLNPSRPNARNGFTKLAVEISRRQTLDAILPNLGLYAVLAAQTSFGDPLLSSEQFGVGGSVIGTGYDPSEITGDSGISGRVELQYAASLAKLGVTQFYGFYDAGRTHNVESLFGETRNRSLSSAGAGVRFSVLRNFSGYVEVAKPLTRAVQTQILSGSAPRPARVFFGLTARY